VLCLGLLLPTPAWAASGYYTAEHAAAGKPAYITNCAGCHGYNLQGFGAPTLKGKDFLAAWGTAERLYRFFSKAMPASNPGMLSPQTYTELLAYLMSANGIPPGSQTLGDSDDARAGIELMRAAALATDTAAEPKQARPL
jgi:alcohol dehydrogenase (cytochrome c)